MAAIADPRGRQGGHYGKFYCKNKFEYHLLTNRYSTHIQAVDMAVVVMDMAAVITTVVIIVVMAVVTITEDIIVDMEVVITAMVFKFIFFNFD